MSAGRTMLRTAVAFAAVTAVTTAVVLTSERSGPRPAKANQRAAVGLLADAPSRVARPELAMAAHVKKKSTPNVATVQGTLSPPLRTLSPKPVTVPRVEREPESPSVGRAVGTSRADPVIQRTQGPGAMPAPSMTFEGVNAAQCACSPPDVAGDVGLTRYVEWVNTSYAVFNKTGMMLAGPVPGNQIFTALGSHDCATQNAGDPLVLYDQLKDRWVLSQFTIGDPVNALGPYYQCVAVSTTSDPLGSYCLYPFQTPVYGGQANDWIFPDYGKIGLWKDLGGTQDAYFFSFAGFPDDGQTFTPAAMAVERSKMLTAGCPAAKSIWFDASNSALVVSNASQDGTERILPTDLDGFTFPPAGEPDYFYTTGLFGDTDSLQQWEFHVDWTTPALSTFTLAHTIPVPPYDQTFNCFTPPATSSTRDCIPQLGATTTNKLDVFVNGGRQRIMWRAAYRNFHDHRSVVFHHAADAGDDSAVAGADIAGLRWYEIRDPEGTPVAYQAGTYAPADNKDRWMGSLAQDSNGNIAFGYSISSATTYPSIMWAGQLEADLSNPANKGILTQGEATMYAGGGSQQNTGSRWGDYSSMSVDPSDDCTFWYANEYYQTTGPPPNPPYSGDATWHTRIGTFKYPSCMRPTATTVSHLKARRQ